MSRVRTALLLALSAACAQPRRDTRSQEPVRVAQVVPPDPPKPVVGDGLVIEYRVQAEGRTLIEVAQPPGTQVEVLDGPKVIGRDTAPTSVRTEADQWYRVRVRLPSGLERERKVQAVHGLVTSIRFVDVAPAGPVAITRDQFRDLVSAIDREPGDAAKLAVLRTASGHSWFTTAMVGVLLEHIVHRENKLEAVPLLKDRIVDKQNAYTLYQHFTYREDKAKVQEILEK